MDTRDLTLSSFADTLRFQAVRLAQRGANILLEDLLQDGWVGLLECYERFAGANFQTVAPYYLKKALYESVYRQTGASINVRRFAAKVEKTRQALRLELWREPTDAEIAGRIGLTEARLRQRLLTVRIMQTVCQQGGADEPSARFWSGKRLTAANHKGEANGNAKITAAQAREIRARAANGESRRSLRDAYALTKTPLARIIRGETWSNA